MIIILLGGPGSGKGTQVKMLCDALNLSFFSSGDLARKLAKKDSRIAEIMNKKGQWIPEEEMTKHVSEHLKEKHPDLRDIVFEGYPRFISQYKHLKKWLKDRGVQIDRVIVLNISEKEAIRRLAARRVDKKTGEIYNLLTNPPGSGIDKDNLIQRKDDKEQVIKRRFDQYRKHSEPIKKLAKKDGILVEIDAEQSIEKIHQELMRSARGFDKS